MNLEDSWCQRAIDIIKDVEVNVLIAKLNKDYSYDECKKYDLIASCTTGTDHIENKEVPLISLKGETDFLSGIYATAEMTWSLILSLIRRIPFAFDDVKQGNWDREAWQGSELRGKTLGIIGLGRVGYQVMQIADAFGMRICFYDPKYIAHTETPLEWVLQNSDIITVHVPLNESTKCMFGMEQFKLMKPTSFFINTSRALIVHDQSLYNALCDGQIAGAAIDVMEGYPHKYWEYFTEYAKQCNNLIITPHLGGQTKESREKTQVYLAQKIREWIYEQEKNKKQD